MTLLRDLHVAVGALESDRQLADVRKLRLDGAQRMFEGAQRMQQQQHAWL